MRGDTMRLQGQDVPNLNIGKFVNVLIRNWATDSIYSNINTSKIKNLKNG
jgi:hypothetical protein